MMSFCYGLLLNGVIASEAWQSRVSRKGLCL